MIKYGVHFLSVLLALFATVKSKSWYSPDGQMWPRSDRYYRMERSAVELGLVRKEEIQTIDNKTPNTSGKNMSTISCRRQ